MAPLNKPEPEDQVDEQPLVVELEPETVEVEIEEPEVVEEQPEQVDDAKGLAQQIEALKVAQEQDAQRITKAESERDQAVNFARQREHQAFSERQQRTSTEVEMIQNAMQAAQAEQQAAQLALDAAFAEGDSKAMGAANARIARAATDIRTFEQTAAQLAQQKEQEAWHAQQMQRQPQQQQPQRQYTPTELLAAAKSNPQLMPQESQWLDRHPEVVTNPRLNQELEAVWNGAIRKGLVRGTPEYFQHIESAMGLNPAAEPRGNNMAAKVSAPVTRANPGASPSKGIKLSAEQVELANSMGFKTPDQLKMYARNVQKQREADSKGARA